MNRLTQMLSVGLISGLAVCATAEAGFFDGHIVAHFQNPILQGNVAAGGGYHNNTSSAHYSMSGPGSTATLQWGSAPGFSQINFVANQSVSTLSDVPFNFGTITFYNGTSALESLIFGATLVLDFVENGGSGVVDTLYLPLGIVTTLNGGGPDADADYVSISGLDRSLFSRESLGATANLSGAIVGDPYFMPLGLELDPDSLTILDPNDPTKLNTFIIPGFGTQYAGFTGPTPSAVPEPSSLALLGLGGLGLALNGYRRRRAIASV